MPDFNMLKKADKVGIVCCSNGQTPDQKPVLEKLLESLCEFGLQPFLSPALFANTSIFGCSAQERAEILMDFYRDADIKAVFDISGGDVANMMLPHLDYTVIASNPKPFWGYSDLTTVLNGIYAKTGNRGILYQVKNIVWDESGVQKDRMARYCSPENDSMQEDGLFDIAYEFLRGKKMEGIVVGGNLRCLLKLAGTPYWPCMQDKILLLEGLGGGVAQYATYLAQLSQLGVFEQVSGILLGTFTEMEQQGWKPGVEDMLLELLQESVSTKVRNLPVAKTRQIGHGVLAKAIVIGQKLSL